VPTVRSLASKQEKVVLLSWLATLPDTGRPEPLLTAPRARATVPRTAPAFAHPGRRRARPRLPREPEAGTGAGAAGAALERDEGRDSKGASPLVAPPTPLAVPSPFGLPRAQAGGRGEPGDAAPLEPEPQRAPEPAAAAAAAAAGAPCAAPPPRQQEPSCLVGPGAFGGYREFYLLEVEPAFPEGARPPAMRPAMALLGMHCRMEVGARGREAVERLAWLRGMPLPRPRPRRLG
jgi:hypothetical protein